MHIGPNCPTHRAPLNVARNQYIHHMQLYGAFFFFLPILDHLATVVVFVCARNLFPLSVLGLTKRERERVMVYGGGGHCKGGGVQYLIITFK